MENIERDQLSPEQLLELEKREIDALMARGIELEFGKKKFLVKPFYRGTIDILSSILIEMEIDKREDEDVISYANRYLAKVNKHWADLTAVAILNSKWKIRLLRGLLRRRLMWMSTNSNSELEAMVEVIRKMMNIQGFIHSTRLIAGLRTTKPNPVEEGLQA